MVPPRLFPKEKNMHFCKASIAIGGDSRNIMTRDEFNPVSWPEFDILRLLHGDDAVADVVPFVRVSQTGRDERARLALIYGEGPLQMCWGGRNPPAELEAPGATLPDKVTWQNPITGRIEGELRMPVPPPADLAETVGDMARPPAAAVMEDEERETETAADDFGGPGQPSPAVKAAQRRR
jgi:hypothetical protein